MGRPSAPGLRNALTSEIYRARDIEELVAGAGLSPGDLALDQTGRALWFSAMKLAAGHKVLPRLVELAVQRVPAAIHDDGGEMP